MTLAFAELEGRYYGGGVLELTPNEFRTLPIPLVQAEDFQSYTSEFKNKSKIEDVLNSHNTAILNRSLNLSSDEIKKIEFIRRKLIDRRQRK